MAGKPLDFLGLNGVGNRAKKNTQAADVLRGLENKGDSTYGGLADLVQ
jgi:hypothetical protein